MSLTPTVAIVGRPNVGKSTLFNRLLGRRQAIVHDLPGITRDRITGIAHLLDDRPIQIVDTGGLVPGDDPLGLNEQVFLAVQESDLLLFVVDGKLGLVSADEEVWSHFRRFGKPALLVVNKGDTREARNRFPEFYSLGIDRQLLVSAEHGGGIEDLREALALTLPEIPDVPAPDAPPIAIVGRPNVGKSSLLNKISGLNRALVSPVAGTTRDPVDTLITRGDKSYLLIDTAGIRRRSQVTGAPEELAVMMARRQIERAQVVVLVVDAAQSVTSGDLAIAGSIWELGRAAVVAINKWDLLDDEAREKLEFSFQRLDELLASPGRVNVSALSGRGVDKLWGPIDRALDSYNLKLSTGQLNRLFERFVKKVAPPSLTGAPWKLYYVTQVSAAPPTFMLFANRTLPRNSHYRRYLENRLREELGLPGVPLRLVVRKRTE
ncbi:MAG TPA: ribosome biogenesis GTPase Der [Thermoanaerobaculia bacterium]|jgi:GTP-binding protein|nr:ribosome biogenesis GTPase Der [Thermoanaerobaculia bacterium]